MELTETEIKLINYFRSIVKDANNRELSVMADEMGDEMMELVIEASN